MNRRLSAVAKARLVLKIWFWYVIVRVQSQRHSLPALVRRLSVPGRVPRTPLEPIRLGRIVYRVLGWRSHRVRCLFTSLVLFKLLRQGGSQAEIVIGLPKEPQDKDAHAWVEINKRDVGPPPGSSRHQELARYG